MNLNERITSLQSVFDILMEVEQDFGWEIAKRDGLVNGRFTKWKRK